jgi:Zn finger protein HypA/HybF involved in hydrogenase expression
VVLAEEVGKMIAPRTYLKTECFELRCHTCQNLVSLATDAVTDNVAHCPKCDALLEIRWSEAA